MDELRRSSDFSIFSSINFHIHPNFPSKTHYCEKFHGFYINETTIKLIIKLMLLMIDYVHFE